MIMDSLIALLGRAGQILSICDHTLLISPFIQELPSLSAFMSLEELARAVDSIPHEVLHAVCIGVNNSLSLLK